MPIHCQLLQINHKIFVAFLPCSALKIWLCFGFACSFKYLIYIALWKSHKKLSRINCLLTRSLYGLCMMLIQFVMISGSHDQCASHMRICYDPRSSYSAPSRPFISLVPKSYPAIFLVKRKLAKWIEIVPSSKAKKNATKRQEKIQRQPFFMPLLFITAIRTEAQTHKVENILTSETNSSIWEQFMHFS